MNNVSAVVLAAGKGTRMGSEIPKVLFELQGKPLIYWPLKLLADLKITPAIVVTGYKSASVEAAIKKQKLSAIFVHQIERKGTAHSLKVALPKVPKNANTILVLYGDDSALYEAETIRDLVKFHQRKKNLATFLTLERKTPSDIGALKIEKGRVIGVMTLSMIIAAKMKVHHILCGAFCFDKSWITEALPLVEPSSMSGEYPLPGLIKVAMDRGETIDTFMITDKTQWQGINTQEELKLAEKIKSKKNNK